MDSDQEKNHRGHMFTVEGAEVVVEYYHFGEDVAYEYAEQLRFDDAGQAQIADGSQATVRISGAWLFKYIKALFYRVVPEGTAKSTLNSLRLPMISYFPITIPNTCEISAIEQWIQSEGHNFHRLTAEAQSATTVLQERRGALISAAVTFKINVRGLVEWPLLEAA